MTCTYPLPKSGGGSDIIGGNSGWFWLWWWLGDEWKLLPPFGDLEISSKSSLIGSSILTVSLSSSPLMKLAELSTFTSTMTCELGECVGLWLDSLPCCKGRVNSCCEFSVISWFPETMLHKLMRCTRLVFRTLRKVWRETRQQPSTTRSSHQLSCCLVLLYLLHDILNTCPVIKWL